ncbi:MAG: hypothetical protein H6582_01200 [Crocinitomicaceae bacterium]|nr:hypothetical protein [Crocinitomicaceae bacterium]
MQKFDQKTAIAKAAERVRQEKEAEKERDAAYYQKITSGNRWLFFKGIVVFTTLMLILTTYDTFVMGPTEKISPSEWEMNRELYRINYQSIWVHGHALFTPHLEDWIGHLEEGFEVTYTPIFHDEKILSFLQVPYTTEGNAAPIRHYVWRDRSIYNWFPLFQIMLLIPLLTFLLRRPKPWFNYLRMASMVLILPGTIFILIYILM